VGEAKKTGGAVGKSDFEKSRHVPRESSNGKIKPASTLSRRVIKESSASQSDALKRLADR